MSEQTVGPAEDKTEETTKQDRPATEAEAARDAVLAEEGTREDAEDAAQEIFLSWANFKSSSLIILCSSLFQGLAGTSKD